MTVSLRRLLVGNAAGVTAYSLGGSSQATAAKIYPGVHMLSGEGDGPVAAIGRKRVCRLEPGEVACTLLDFAPSGVGVVLADSSVVVADRSGGTIVPLRVAGSTLKAGEPIPVGPQPRGNLLSFQGRLYVPIQRGLAVVDLVAKAKTAVIRLPTSAEDVWISPTGRLFATLPASDAVAVVDLASARPAAQLVEVGHRPQGIAGAGGTVYVANTADGTLTLLSATTGERLGEPRSIAALHDPVVAPTVATKLSNSSTATTVKFGITFAGPRLDGAGSQAQGQDSRRVGTGRGLARRHSNTRR